MGPEFLQEKILEKLTLYLLNINFFLDLKQAKDVKNIRIKYTVR